MNWKELKDFCNNLPDSELYKKVMLWREEDAITDVSAFQLEEDQYISEYSEDGCFSESVANEFIKNDPEDYPNGILDFEKVYDKGHPVLHENF